MLITRRIPIFVDLLFATDENESILLTVDEMSYQKLETSEAVRKGLGLFIEVKIGP